MVREGRGLSDWNEARERVDRGLRYLRSQQTKESGAVGSRYVVAVTSLTGLAILGAGYQPHQEPYGSMLRSCLRHVLASTREGIHHQAGEAKPDARPLLRGPFLCEILGSLEPEEEEGCHAVIKQAVSVIEKADPRRRMVYFRDNADNQDGGLRDRLRAQALGPRGTWTSVDGRRSTRSGM